MSNIKGREAEAFAIIVEGMSVKEVAIKMGISDQTVKVYVKAILREYNLNSRAMLIAKVKNDEIARLKQLLSGLHPSY